MPPACPDAPIKAQFALLAIDPVTGHTGILHRSGKIWLFSYGSYMRRLKSISSLCSAQRLVHEHQLSLAQRLETDGKFSSKFKWTTTTSPIRLFGVLPQWWNELPNSIQSAEVLPSKTARMPASFWDFWYVLSFSLSLSFHHETLWHLCQHRVLRQLFSTASSWSPVAGLFLICMLLWTKPFSKWINVNVPRVLRNRKHCVVKWAVHSPGDCTR